MKIVTLFCICYCIAVVYSLPQRTIGANSDEDLEVSKELRDVNNNSSEESSEENVAGPLTLSRTKRQSVYRAMDLASNHNNHKVGKPYGQFDSNGSGNNLRNYNAQVGVGVGSTLWRSPNDRHSLGAGVYAGQNFGAHQGYRYQSKPDVGYGLGYRFRF